MARNRHGVKPIWPSKCDKCKDRGYTINIPQAGILVPCDECERGVQVEKKLDIAVQTLRTCRKFSRDGIYVPRVLAK